MTENKLDHILMSLVRQHGHAAVEQSLREIKASSRQDQRFTKPEESRSMSKRMSATKPKKGKPKTTAPDYVSRMDLPSEKGPVLAKLAEDFQNKTFLPTIGDIRNFCEIYGINEPTSKSRIDAIPRIFKFLSNMAIEDVQNILDISMFSGPSRLAPIADAIRRNAEQRATTHSRITGAITSSQPHADTEPTGSQRPTSLSKT